MKVSDALSILGLGNRTNLTLEEVKQAYRKACSKYHPDRNPAGAEMMKAINPAWEYLQKVFSESTSEFLNNKESTNQKQAADYGDLLNKIINELLKLDGLIIEVTGVWVWVTGDTKKHKDKLGKKDNGLGLFYSKTKQAWYFRPEEYKSYNRCAWDMEKIREFYGSSAPKNQTYTTIEASA